MIPTFSERAGDMRARASLESEKPLNGGTQRVRARAQPGPLDLPAVSALFRGMNTIVGPKKPWPSALPSNGLGRGSRAAGARNALQVPNWLWPSCVHSTPGKCMAAPRTSCTLLDITRLLLLSSRLRVYEARRKGKRPRGAGVEAYTERTYNTRYFEHRRESFCSKVVGNRLEARPQGAAPAPTPPMRRPRRTSEQVPVNNAKRAARAKHLREIKEQQRESLAVMEAEEVMSYLIA
ncbi:hypothetical protein EV121DRAFT_274466 [Schizophyllum commune]